MRSRYAASPRTKAQYRDRISASAVGAAAAPEWKRPQHFSYGSGSPHGQERVVMAPILPAPPHPPATARRDAARRGAAPARRRHSGRRRREAGVTGAAG
ncbi:hypothetical protein GCM10023336_27900 [Streptomyces similanensis]|uniref:Uncharacterized protein n=1 Tax=Streptomyces similanensis TaxID=1274988 RepID=A0ABP9KBY1_9ACTN